jgi:hypothetical protein
MSKIFGLVAAAALFASVTAFAQNQSSAPASDTASAPAAAPSDDSAKPEKPMHKHGGHHHHMAGMRGGTDENADKLNACMSNATPTSQQESCLKQAAGTGNG